MESTVGDGCRRVKKKEEGKIKPEFSLFSEQDLTPGALNSIPQDEVAAALAGYPALQSNSGSYGLADSASDCLSNTINALPVTAEKSNVKLFAEIDVKDCFADADSGLTIEPIPLRFLVWQGCKNDDLEKLDGKTIAEVSEEANIGCSSEGSQQFIMNLDFKIIAKGEVVKGDVSFPVAYEYRSLSAQQTADGSACTAAMDGDNWVWEDSCFHVSKQGVTQFDVGGKTIDDALVGDFLKLSYAGIAESSSSTASWYVGGRFDVILNDWTGTVTYSGADTPPAYSLVRGETTEDGSLSLAKASLLIGPSLENAIRRLDKH